MKVICSKILESEISIKPGQLVSIYNDNILVHQQKVDFHATFTEFRVVEIEEDGKIKTGLLLI